MAGTDTQDIASTGLDTFAPYLMNRVIRRYNEATHSAMDAAGLTVPKMRALSSLAAKGSLTINELAVYAVSEQSTMSRIVDQLEREGLVARQQSQADHRVRLVSLTDQGHATYQELWPHFSKEQDRLLGALTDEERAELLFLLTKILRSVRRNPL